jgi:hypothetical protein
MKSFLSRFQSLVLFVLTGFDRLRFRGDSRLLNQARGVESYCYQQHLLFKNFPAHAKELTEVLRSQTKQQLGEVPFKHLNDPKIDKEATALQLAQQHGLTSGRIAVLTCQEFGLTYQLRKNQQGLIEPRKEPTRCVHYYHYFLHEQLGLCYVRIQSWFPFTVRVGMNGRRWLAQQLRNRGVGFQQRDNLITAVDDVDLAQALLDKQKYTSYPDLMRDLVRPVHPLWDYLHQEVRTPFYWMAEQTEWATDYIFRSPDDLALWYPRFVQHSILNLSCKDVMRYLGKKVPEHGYGACSGEAKIDLRERPEGTRVKFWYDTNSEKMYDKGAAKVEGQGGAIALRLENTMNNPKPYKVFRAKEGEPEDAPKSWQHLRQGVADMPRRAEVGEAANRRLAESLASVAAPDTLGDLLKPLGQPVFAKTGRRKARALNPLTGADGGLLRAVAKGDYLINGFRNRDLRADLFGACDDAKQRRQQSARITRLFALLQAHGIIMKVQKTHRYQLTAQGRRITTALLTAHAASAEKLGAAA